MRLLGFNLYEVGAQLFRKGFSFRSRNHIIMSVVKRREASRIFLYFVKIKASPYSGGHGRPGFSVQIFPGKRRTHQNHSVDFDSGLQNPESDKPAKRVSEHSGIFVKLTVLEDIISLLNIIWFVGAGHLRSFNFIPPRLNPPPPSPSKKILSPPPVGRGPPGCGAPSPPPPLSPSFCWSPEKIFPGGLPRLRKGGLRRGG